MKKFLLVLLVFIATITFAQTEANLVKRYNVSNGDTTFTLKFSDTKVWDLQINITNPTGTKDGLFLIEESNDNINWRLYSSNSYFILDSNSTVIGSNTFYNVLIYGTDTIYNYGYSHDVFGSNYIKAKIIQNGMTGGIINAILTFKKIY